MKLYLFFTFSLILYIYECIYIMNKRQKFNYYVNHMDEYSHMIIHIKDLVKLSNPDITDKQYIDIIMKYIN